MFASLLLVSALSSNAFALMATLEQPCPEDGEPIKIQIGGGLHFIGECDVGGLDPHMGTEDPAGNTGNDPPMLIVNFYDEGTTSLYLVDSVEGDTIVYTEVLTNLEALLNVDDVTDVALLDLNGDGLTDLLVGDPTGLSEAGALWAFEDIRGGSRSAREYDRGLSGPYAGFGLGAAMDLFVSERGTWTLYVGGTSSSLAVSMTARSYIGGLKGFTSRDLFEYRW